MKEKSIRFNIEVPEKVRYKLKEIAAKRNISLKKLISRLFAELIIREDKHS